ncbi:Pex19 protein [Paxillus ammoniavirescens]|nr:Pex19 protein [Paxillus ammoniavirescens]
MESLFKDLGLDPSSTSGSPDAHASNRSDTAEQRAAFASAWEAMLTEGMDAMVSEPPNPSAAPSSSSSPPQPKGEDDFQTRIRSTMSKLKESESGLKPSGPPPAGADTLEALLSQLGDLSGDVPEGEEQLQGVLEAMMGQLMGKDILYEPLKELYDKFPEYLTERSSVISPEDEKRFDAQILCIKQLLDVFEAKDYRDEDPKAREKIVELMGKLQDYGSPPEEIMGPLPPGFNMGADGLPENCVIS